MVSDTNFIIDLHLKWFMNVSMNIRGKIILECGKDVFIVSLDLHILFVPVTGYRLCTLHLGLKGSSRTILNSLENKQTFLNTSMK